MTQANRAIEDLLHLPVAIYPTDGFFVVRGPRETTSRPTWRSQRRSSARFSPPTLGSPMRPAPMRDRSHLNPTATAIQMT